MQQIAIQLAEKFVCMGIIEEDKKDNYIYGIEFLIMKMVGISIMGIIGIVTQKPIETIVFYITFNSLRKYTNGYHSEKALLCVFESIIVYWLICTVVGKVLEEYIDLLHLMTFLSMIMIYILSPVNTESIMLDESEIKEHKKNIKQVLLIDLLILAMFINFQIKVDLIVFFDLAILLDLLLVLVGIVLNKRKEKNDERC